MLVILVFVWKIKLSSCQFHSFSHPWLICKWRGVATWAQENGSRDRMDQTLQLIHSTNHWLWSSVNKVCTHKSRHIVFNIFIFIKIIVHHSFVLFHLYLHLISLSSCRLSSVLSVCHFFLVISEVTDSVKKCPTGDFYFTHFLKKTTVLILQMQPYIIFKYVIKCKYSDPFNSNFNPF